MRRASETRRDVRCSEDLVASSDAPLSETGQKEIQTEEQITLRGEGIKVASLTSTHASAEGSRNLSSSRGQTC
jgi:hypothetical protein